eukprot:g75050.t1
MHGARNARRCVKKALRSSVKAVDTTN